MGEGVGREAERGGNVRRAHLASLALKMEEGPGDKQAASKSCKEQGASFPPGPPGRGRDCL